MKQVVTQTKETVVKEEVKYIAFDGEEFLSEFSCQKYEHEKKRERLLKRNDIEISRDFGAPCDGSAWYACEDEYLWIRPKTSSAWLEMNKAFDSMPEQTDVGKWTCFVYNEWKDLISCHGEDDITQAMIKQLNALGYTVTLQKKRE